MRRFAYTGSIGLLMSASACSGLLGIDPSTLVQCTDKNNGNSCPAGQTCQDHHCVAAVDSAVSAGGSSNAGATGSGAGQSSVGGQTASEGGGAGGLSSGGSMSAGASTGGSTCAGTAIDGGVAACAPGAHRCFAYDGSIEHTVYWQTCDSDCTWNKGTYCSEYCTIAEGCRNAPSCVNTNPSSQNLDYCASTPILGGSFNRNVMEGKSYCTVDAPCPATVGPFSLDIYEVTVRRFRNFVAAYSQDMIAPGQGKSSKIQSDTGWNESWNSLMPLDSPTLVQGVENCSGSTYTDRPLNNEFLPINCVTWYLAYAFCIWDGGRLPTELEWEFAGSGGEGRYYPWSSPADSHSIDSDHAVYSLSAPKIVGSLPDGVARWGQFDMAGNIEEWTYDVYGDIFPNLSACDECANLDWTKATRVTRGGSYLSGATGVTESFRLEADASHPWPWFGFRCARDL